ncbi:MAG: hypothetical protein CTY15_07005 [Methylocystis sp.]|nr:MAG: hypothetical protein CTY15_07005 [Methylocystis sp.]
MSQIPGKRPQPQKERSQKPLWLAISGLVISVFSFTMQDLMIGDVVMWFGGVFAAISVAYYFLQPTHGLPK